MRSPAVLATLLLIGCGQAAFVRDDRLEIVAPREAAVVRTPLVVEWRARDLPAGTLFGVFVDRPPMRPGQGLAALAGDDPVCRRTPGCPDRTWLERRGVRLTRRPLVVLEALPAGGTRKGRGGLPRHEIAIVLLDARGVRTGESAWRRVVYGR